MSFTSAPTLSITSGGRRLRSTAGSRTTRRRAIDPSGEVVDDGGRGDRIARAERDLARAMLEVSARTAIR